MNYFRHVSIIFAVLYVQILLTIFIYIPETRSPFNIVGPFVIMITLYSGFYFLVKFIQLDLYFLYSNNKFKFTSLFFLILFITFFVALISDNENFFDINSNDTGVNTYEIIVVCEGLLIALLYMWFIIVSVTTFVLDIVQQTIKAVPSILEKGSDMASDVADKIKKTYEDSNFPLKNKVKKEKLLAELAELTDVEPEKRNYHKSDFQSKTEDIKQINPLERELRVKELKKKIKELEEQ